MHEVLGRLARREPADDRRLGRLLRSRTCREVIYDAEHFFDGFKRNPEYALRTLQAAADAGAAWIVLCDTNGGTLPERGRRGRRRRSSGEIKVPLGIHTHNDCDLAVANTLAAVRQGATQVQGTINGIGERCGNVDLCSVIANLALKYPGYEVLLPGKLAHLTEVSRYVYETANMNFRPGQPFVGASAFAHKGGMHVHGVRKNAASYEHIDPETVGNERRVLVSELSGKSNIAEKLAEYGLEHDTALLARVLDRVQDLENEGYQFEAAEASFDLLVERLAGRHIGRGSSSSATTSASRARPTASPLDRGDGQAPRRRRGRAHRQRGRRPGQRPGRRPAQGPRAALPAAPGDAPGRLQGPRDQRPGRHRRPGPRGDREQRTTTRSGARSASARTSSRRAGWRWSTPSSTSFPGMRGRRPRGHRTVHWPRSHD